MRLRELKSRPSLFSLGQIAPFLCLSDLRLLSERLLFFCFLAFELVNIAWRIRRKWNDDRFYSVPTYTHLHTLPSKRWVVRMCCIYLKMAEASRPGIGYTYRLIFSLLSSTDRSIAVGFRSLALGVDGGCWSGDLNTPLVSHSRNCEVGLERSFFRTATTAYLASLLPRLGGSSRSGLLACEGAGWYWTHCMSLISEPTPKGNTTHLFQTNRNQTHPFLIHRERRIWYAPLCWKKTSCAPPLPPLTLSLTIRIPHTKRHIGHNTWI